MEPASTTLFTTLMNFVTANPIVVALIVVCLVTIAFAGGWKTKEQKTMALSNRQFRKMKQK